MRDHRAMFFAGTASVLWLTGWAGFGQTSIPAQAVSQAGQGRMRAALENLPLHFIENQGQLDSRVAYYVQGRDSTVYFSPQGVTFALMEKARPVSLAGAAAISNVVPATLLAAMMPQAARQRYAVKLDFLNANLSVRIHAQDPTPAVISYFKGRPDEWKTGLATYSKLVYEELWPGIDLVYAGAPNRLKYQFVVKPAADPNRIKLAYRGATAVKVNPAGQLEVSTPVGGFHDDIPYSFQEVEGRRVAVDTAYILESDSNSSRQAYGFRVGAYDKSLPLTVDPTVLLYSGFVGGAADDRAMGIAVDSAGNSYITGITTSSSATFPVLAGPDRTYHGNQDAFVAKVNAAGTALVYAGYIGGSGTDAGFGIAVDSAGNAYITGSTNSTQTSFPVIAGPGLVYKGGAFDAFVAKVNPTGTALVYCGYIGGARTDGGARIAVDAGGNAYITGATTSFQNTFPVTGGPKLTYGGGRVFGDAFVAKVNPQGTALVYCGYIGGVGEDAGLGIAVDSSGNAYVTGGTTSTEATFPVRAGPKLTFLPGYRHAFVAKVNPSGSALVYCGFIGGANGDTGFGIAVDSAGNAYVAGETSSSETSFPVLVGPRLTYNGGGDAFVAKVNPAGTALIYAGYIGGAGRDGATAIAVDSAGNAYVTGATASSESSFPVRDGPGLTYNGGPFLGDAFVARVNAAGSALDYAGYIGGSGDDLGYSIALDSAGNAYVAGETSSSDGSFPLRVGPGTTYAGGVRDGFVAKIGLGANLLSPFPGAALSSGAITFSWTPVAGATRYRLLIGSSFGAGDLFNQETTATSRSVTGLPTDGRTLYLQVSSFVNNAYGVPSAYTYKAFTTRVPLRFVPLPPCRVMETRSAYNFEGRTGAFGPPTLASGETRTLNLPLSNVCAIPSTARAYVVNVTVIPTRTVSFATLWPAGDPRPNVWTIRSPDGQIVANSAIVRAGINGGISLYSSDNTDLLIDISGYYTDNTAVTGLVYYSLTPCRVIDTRILYRSPAGPYGPPSMTARQTRKFRLPATPYCAVPQAAAYSVTITAVPPAPLAYLTAWPDGGSQPNVSSINSFAGRVLANSLITPASADGTIDVFTYDTTDFLIDINGYYAPDDGQKGLFYFPVTQCRASDSTVSGGVYPDDSARTINVPSAPQCSGIPSNAQGYAINVTALPNGNPMPFITAYPTGQPRPNASILNAFQGQVVSNSAIIPAGTNGAIDVYAYRRTDVVVEVSGYFGR